MATMVKLSRQVPVIVQCVYSDKNQAEASRFKEYEAVVRIQSWYRGLRVRAYLRFLNESALLIQKAFRGYQGRKEFRVYLRNEVFVMKLNHYNRCAAKIQKVWRGFYVRKYVFNYYSFKRYLNGLQIKNAAIREKLADYRYQQEQMRRIEEQRAQKDAKESWLQKNHHLVSTVAVPGIYNSPYLPYPTEIEMHLRSTKLIGQIKRKPSSSKFNPSGTSYDLPRPNSLPPLPQKPQGPFREPEEVRDQRYKPFKPSLRVETSYFALEEGREKLRQEEWISRLVEAPFKPFTTRHRDYEPLHHTTTQYGHLAYGNAYFREEFKDKFIGTETMKTVVPPIPIFDKLNSTYSQGEV